MAFNWTAINNCPAPTQERVKKLRWRLTSDVRQQTHYIPNRSKYFNIHIYEKRSPKNNENENHITHVWFTICSYTKPKNAQKRLVIILKCHSSSQSGLDLLIFNMWNVWTSFFFGFCSCFLAKIVSGGQFVFFSTAGRYSIFHTRCIRLLPFAVVFTIYAQCVWLIAMHTSYTYMQWIHWDVVADRPAGRTEWNGLKGKTFI